MSLFTDIEQYLSCEEADQINKRLSSAAFQPNRQILWNGLKKEDVQVWANKRAMQTLTTAMGPLMDKSDPLCLKTSKSEKGWSKYVKGASILFAHRIARNDSVIVLSQPPPQRLHPSGLTTYQQLEEPILKGYCGSRPILQINMVHPTVKGAEDFVYQLWPLDQRDTWLARFGTRVVSVPLWRPIHGYTIMSVLQTELKSKSITLKRKSSTKREQGKQEGNMTALARQNAPGTITTTTKAVDSMAREKRVLKGQTPHRKEVKKTTAKTGKDNKKLVKKKTKGKRAKEEKSKKKKNKKKCEKAVEKKMLAKKKKTKKAYVES